MPVEAAAATTARLDVGDLWVLAVLVTSETSPDSPTTADVAVEVTDPAGTTSSPTATALATGVYRAAPVVSAAGRWVARVTATDHGVVLFAADVADLTAAAAMPTDDDVVAYLGDVSSQWEAGERARVLAAELQAQRDVCRIPATYNAALREAVLRRVQRNLAMRSLPLAVFQGDADGGSTILPGRDPEVRRLEAPYRKRKVG